MSPPPPPHTRPSSHRPGPNTLQQPQNNTDAQRGHMYKSHSPAPPLPAHHSPSNTCGPTLMVLTKQTSFRGRSPTKRAGGGGLDKSDRSARSDGFISVKSHSRTVKMGRKQSMRKRCNSADNLGEMIGRMEQATTKPRHSMVDLPQLPKEIHSKPNRRKSNPNIIMDHSGSEKDPDMYHQVLMDLFSSVAATRSNGEGLDYDVAPPPKKKDETKRSGSNDGSDLMETPQRNSFVDGTPHRHAASRPKRVNNTAENQEKHHKRGSSGDMAVAPLPHGGNTGDMPRNSSDMMLHNPTPRRKSIDPENNRKMPLRKCNETGRGSMDASNKMPRKCPSKDQIYDLSANQTPQKQTNPPKPINQIDSHSDSKQPARLNSDNHKLKLYDEILSASDPKIGKTIVWPNEETNSTDPDPSYLMGSINKGMNKKGDGLIVDFDRNGEKFLCRRYKHFIIIGLFLLLSGLGVGAYFFFFRGYEEEDTAGELKDGSTPVDVVKDENENSIKLNMTIDESSPPSSNTTGIAPPPADIEARCSASNLPGSLSTCLAACLPSACCYPGFASESCLDNIGCPAYRPHCDVFYDAWIGSTEGVLREVTDEMLTVCGAGAEASVSFLNAPSTNSSPTSNSTNFQVPPLSEGVNSTSFGPAHSRTANAQPNSSTTVKRLRGHVIQDNAGGTGDARKLQPSQETCQQYCIAAKCCSATIVTDAQSFGLIFSPTGVYTDALGEHVVTNCQVSNSQNVGLCAKYQAFCSTDAVAGNAQPNTPGSSIGITIASGKPVELPSSTPESLPQIEDYFTPDASNNGSVSISLTLPNQENSSNATIEETSNPGSPIQLSSTPSPSTTLGTVTSSASNPAASIQEIQDACASDQATFLISTGDTSARTKCIQACQNGLCCFTTQLGYEWMESCQTGNQLACMKYSPCLVLAQGQISQGNAIANPAESTFPVGENGALSVDNTDVSGIESSSVSNKTTAFVPDAAAVGAGTDPAGSTLPDSNPTEQGENETIESSSMSNETTSVPDSTAGTTEDGDAFNESPLNIPEISAVNETTVNIPDLSTVDNPSSNVSAQVGGPPVPTKDLNVLCSEDFISKPAGLEACLQSCELGRCCGADDETGCFATHMETCYLYYPCNAVYDLIYQERNNVT